MENSKTRPSVLNMTSQDMSDKLTDSSSGEELSSKDVPSSDSVVSDYPESSIDSDSSCGRESSSYQESSGEGEEEDENQMQAGKEVRRSRIKSRQPAPKRPRYSKKSDGMSLKDLAKINKLVDKLPIPVINIDGNPQSLVVLKFIRDMEKYKDQDPVYYKPILSKALQGDIAKEWCTSVEYDYGKVLARIHEWLTAKEEWAQTMVKLQCGELFSIDLDMHIYYFKLVATYAHLSLESDEAKRFFIKSMPPVLQPVLDIGPDERPRTFQQLEEFARKGRKVFEEYARGKVRYETKE